VGLPAVHKASTNWDIFGERINHRKGEPFYGQHTTNKVTKQWNIMQDAHMKQL
jgi:hypothetical protein